MGTHPVTNSYQNVSVRRLTGPGLLHGVRSVAHADFVPPPWPPFHGSGAAMGRSARRPSTGSLGQLAAHPFVPAAGQPSVRQLPTRQHGHNTHLGAVSTGSRLAAAG